MITTRAALTIDQVRRVALALDTVLTSQPVFLTQPKSI